VTTRRKQRKLAANPPCVPRDADGFIDELRTLGPAVERLIRDNDDPQDGGVLLHTLVSDVYRWCVDAFERGRTEELDRCLRLLAEGLRCGTEELENAVAVSFVEMCEWWDPATLPFRRTWPLPLREELDRQRR
jgi:hypothetical protein